MQRPTWGVLCASASVLLLLCAAYLLSRDAAGAGVAPVFLIGVGLLAAAVKSFKARRLG
ncbi:MAG TPA: hypothetical protein VM936_12620 [Pyrinomonadaceae bacterium]|nr:hypothetical protein [Pyrinomonadaceae bacterium]